MTITEKDLIEQGFSAYQAEITIGKIHSFLHDFPADLAWQKISKNILNPKIPFKLHCALFSACFPDWESHPENSPAWLPDESILRTSNIAIWLKEKKFSSVEAFHADSVKEFQSFWKSIITRLGIVFHEKPKLIYDAHCSIEKPDWLVQAKINIIDSCFKAPPSRTALIFPDENKQIQKMTYSQLNKLTNRIANSLVTAGFGAADRIAIALPMTMEAVAIYLGIIKMGGVVVSIADSFSAGEIALRLRITKAKAIFTQDFILRSKKRIPLYEKIVASDAPIAIVIPCENQHQQTLRRKDISWEKFLTSNEKFTTMASNPMSAINILFSSGTTGEPKGIVWNHTTAIKAASDAYFHQNIQASDVLTWPTNLGWMMGPWLIFAALINKAAIAVYPDNPNEAAFGSFIQEATVTMLGVVPTLVAAWRHSQCMQNFDWSAIKVFSSTGECSNPKDMLYLMSLANYKPIIEYCGGTEIGGAYVSSTVIQKNCPSIFTTAAFGSEFIILDENGKESDCGEVALVPPAMGLAAEILNADQHQMYFADMPKSSSGKILRRHGDQIRRYQNGFYALLGRSDDTMNLGGIKISSAEIERVLMGVAGIREIAAIAVADKGPARLVIFAVAAKSPVLNKENILREMQLRLHNQLNPLFKIHDIFFIMELPRTASNKIMRRILRDEYEKNSQQNPDVT